MPLMCDGYSYFFVVLYTISAKKIPFLCTKYVLEKGFKKCKIVEYVLKCLLAFVSFSHENIVKTI